MGCIFSCFSNTEEAESNHTSPAYCVQTESRHVSQQPNRSNNQVPVIKHVLVHTQENKPHSLDASKVIAVKEQRSRRQSTSAVLNRKICDVQAATHSTSRDLIGISFAKTTATRYQQKIVAADVKDTPITKPYVTFETELFLFNRIVSIEHKIRLWLTNPELSWDLPKALPNKVYSLICLKPHSAEFAEIYNLFGGSFKHKFYVTKIEMVHNDSLRKQFMLKKELLRKRNGGNINCRTLFHGTKLHNVDSICTNNFNWRYSLTSNNKFGNGIYFAMYPSFATHYCDNGITKVMFVVEVIVTNTCEGRMNLRYLPHPYDATSNQNDTVIVKYEDSEYYPKYLIHFKQNLQD